MNKTEMSERGKKKCNNSFHYIQLVSAGADQSFLSKAGNLISTPSLSRLGPGPFILEIATAKAKRRESAREPSGCRKIRSKSTAESFL